MWGEDLIMPIWSRLSIKSTVRFRCGSKSWCASLSDPHFIFKNLTAANEHDLLLLTDRECQHYYSVVPHEATTTLMATPLQVSPEIPVPLMTLHPISSVLSPPCHDMVCFHLLEYNYRVHSMGVWNLTSGETKTVPLLGMDTTFTTGFTTIGFGFDEKRKEYKIVLIVCLGPDEFEAYVYSLSSSSSNNCWRKVGEPKMLYRYLPCRHYSRSYKDGTFYWAADDLIMSFDMSGEVFKPISVSVQVGVGMSPNIQKICMLKEGSMIIIMNEVSDKWKYTLGYQIWALLDVGVSESWTKLSVIDWDWGREEHDEPLGFWRNELVLHSRTFKPNGRLLVIDPFKRETKKVHIDEPYEITWCFAWTKKREEQFVQV